MPKRSVTLLPVSDVSMLEVMPARIYPRAAFKGKPAVRVKVYQGPEVLIQATMDKAQAQAFCAMLLMAFKD